ncbi:MAG: AAA family ATPase [Candidatus Micrarchaeota archaeon]|nr:AAA family ATPase [Candidatus Micrarchaeota archaeon]
MRILKINRHQGVEVGHAERIRPFGSVSTLAEEAITHKRYTQLLDLFTKVEGSSTYISYRVLSPEIYLKVFKRFLDYILGDPCTNVMYFVGHPGTGKTHFAIHEFREMVKELDSFVDIAMKDLNRMHNFLHSVCRACETKDYDAISSLINTPEYSQLFSSNTIFPILKNIADNVYTDDEKAKLVETIASILKRSFMVENEEKFKQIVSHLHDFLLDKQACIVDTYIVVLPSLNSPTDFIFSREYIFNLGIDVKERHNLLTLLTATYLSDSPKSVILLLDELSELPHRKGEEERSAKNLNSFFDQICSTTTSEATPNSIRLGFNIDQISHEDIEELKRLKENIRLILEKRNLSRYFGQLDEKKFEMLYEKLKALVDSIEQILDNSTNPEVKGKRIEIEIPVPRRLFVVATGNIRNMYNSSGNFIPESTSERLYEVVFGYPQHEKLTEFLKAYVEKLIEQAGINDETIKDKMNKFVAKIIAMYEQITNTNVRRPSIRVIKNALMTYLGSLVFLKNSVIDYMSDKNSSISVSCYSLGSTYYGIKREISLIRSDISQESKKEELYESLSSKLEAHLLSAIIITSMLPTGPMTVLSESDRSYKLIASILTELKNKERANQRLEASNDVPSENQFYIFDMKDKNGITTQSFVYSEHHFLTLCSIVGGLITGQRFTLLTGAPQEGKSTMVRLAKDILATELSRERKEVQYFYVNARELSIIDLGVKVKSGDKSRSLEETELVKALRAARDSPETVCIIHIDEIDMTQEYTQQLNALLTKEQITIGDEVFDLKNVRIVATMNLTTNFLDNFLNRASTYLFYRDFQTPVLPSGIFQLQDAKNESHQFIKLYLDDFAFLFNQIMKYVHDQNKAYDLTVDMLRELNQIYITIGSTTVSCLYFLTSGSRSRFWKPIYEELNSQYMVDKFQKYSQNEIESNELVSEFAQGLKSRLENSESEGR